MVLLVVGIVVVVWVLYAVVSGGLCVEDRRFPDSLEHAHLRRVAEARVAALCPGAIRLAEKERAGGVASRDSVSAHEFWHRFAAASALVEDDPTAALRELRGLPGLLEEALSGVEREVGMVKGVPEREDGR